MIKIVPDTSVLFYLKYGDNNQKNSIIDIFDKSDAIIINETLLNEIGRVLYLPFFEIKTETQRFLIESVENIKILDDFWIKLNNFFSKKYSFKKQFYNRIISILSYLFNKFFNKFSSFFGDSIEYESLADLINSIFFMVEYELWQFKKKIRDFEYIENFKCHQTEWDFNFDSNNGADLILSTKCNRELCPQMETNLRSIYFNNEDLINDIIENHQISDKKLQTTLKKLKVFFNEENNKNLSYKTKYCWNLGDFLISLLVKDDIFIYTRNYNHFLALLMIKGLETNLIKFEI